MHRAVGFIAAGEPPLWMRPIAGEQQRWDILRALASLDTGDTPLALLLESAAPSLGRRANLVVITPSPEGSWLNVLARLAWRGITTTAILIDPSTFGAVESMSALGRRLSEAGIAHQVVGRELFRHPEARPGPSGQWEWRVLPTGKAIPVRRPSDSAWQDVL